MITIDLPEATLWGRPDTHYFTPAGYVELDPERDPRRKFEFLITDAIWKQVMASFRNAGPCEIAIAGNHIGFFELTHFETLPVGTEEDRILGRIEAEIPAVNEPPKEDPGFALLRAIRDFKDGPRHQRLRKTPECDPTLWLAYSIFSNTEHPPIHEDRLWIEIDSLSRRSRTSRADMAEVLRARAAGETIHALAQRFGLSTGRVTQQEAKALRLLRLRVLQFAPLWEAS